MYSHPLGRHLVGNYWSEVLQVWIGPLQWLHCREREGADREDENDGERAKKRRERGREGG